jgi:DNA-binding FrmR family transcriptional regulator
MHLSHHGNPKTLARVRRIKGQVTALEHALVSGHECTAVLQQIAAIRGAVNGLMNEVLSDHLHAHLGLTAQDANIRQRDLEQVLQIVARYLK